MINDDLLPEGDDAKEIKVISENSVVKIAMSTSFYKRIQSVLQVILKDKSNEEINAMHEEIRDRKHASDTTYHYETLLILCNEFETKADEQGCTEMMSIGEMKKKITEDL